MSNENDLNREADDLEAQLLAEEADELRAERRRDETGQERMARLGARAIAQLETRKDSPEAMSEAITQKYLSLGQDLLRDDSSGQLPSVLRDRVQKIMGHDPGDVRVHTGERAQVAADALGAKAFAVGDSDIYFGRGEYRPHTAEGLGVLVHELTHVADNQMAGAALATGSSRADHSAAEERAESAEAFAASAPDGQSEETADSSPEKIDLAKLEEAVHRIMSRGEDRAMDRTGRSGTMTSG